MKIGGFFQWSLIWCPIFWIAEWFLPGTGLGWQTLWATVITFPICAFLDSRITAYRLRKKAEKSFQKVL